MALFDATIQNEAAGNAPASGAVAPSTRGTVAATKPQTIAKQKIVAYLASVKDSLPADVREAAEIFAPVAMGVAKTVDLSQYGIAPTFYTAAQKRLLKLLGKGDDFAENAADFSAALSAPVSVTEDNAFMVLRFGRGDMKKLIKDLAVAKNCVPVYGKFDEGTGAYTFALTPLA